MNQDVYDQCGVVIKKAKSSDIGMWLKFQEIGGDILDRLLVLETLIYEENN